MADELDAATFRILMARVAEGDRSAVAELVERQSDHLRAYLERRLPRCVLRRFGPSDIIQQAAIQLVGAAEDLDDRGLDAFRRLLEVVAERVLAHAIEREYAQKRSLARQVRLDSGATDSAAVRHRLDGLEAGTDSPSRSLMRRERLDAVKRAFEDLPAGDREILLLIDCHGLGHDEAARRLGISGAAARKRHSRAAARLRELLKAEGNRGD